jgi:mono/diheme cytochrome c family protein
MKLSIVCLVLGPALLAPFPAHAQDAASRDRISRGEYLVTITGCHDCHTPLIMGESGPQRDPRRILSGHPQDMVIDAPAPRSQQWGGAFAPTLTAWSGPWGVSFTANLTPDPETGVLRDFTEEQFIQTMRTGRHQGRGRKILPPMPWDVYAKMTDEDLKSVFAYLRQVTPVRNKVPDPLPPAN